MSDSQDPEEVGMLARREWFSEDTSKVLECFNIMKLDGPLRQSCDACNENRY